MTDKFAYYGVRGNGNLGAAIDRAIRAEEELLRFCLELCGPESAWTKHYAHMHDKCFMRGESSARLERIFGELDKKIKKLSEPHGK